MTETYRAIGFIKALRIRRRVPGFRRRGDLSAAITRIFENRQFCKHLAVRRGGVDADAEPSGQGNDAARHGGLDIDPDGSWWSPQVGRYLGEQQVEVLRSGDFFGEEMSIFWTPSMFRLKALSATEVFLVPAGLLAGIPSVRWKLFEASGRRMTSIFESEHDCNPNLLQWREEYRVDVLRLDTQHRRMFEQANAILEAIQAGKGSADIVPLIDAMAEYAHYHFGEEEALMVRHAYPEAESHRGHHALLSQQLQAMRQTFKDCADPCRIDFLAFLRNWLVGHIQAEDRHYTRFLNEKGVY